MAEDPESPDFIPFERLIVGRQQAEVYKAYMKDQVMFLLFREQPEDSFPMVAALGELMAEVGSSLIDVGITVSLLRHLANQLEQGPQAC